MALVKMKRDFPEVAGGKTTADFPEEAVKAAIAKGWRVADAKEAKTEVKQEKVAEPKVAEPKPVVEPKVEDKVEEKKPAKAESQKSKNKRDA